MTPHLTIEVVRHHLALFGIDRVSVGTLSDSGPRVAISANPGGRESEPAMAFAQGGGLVIAIQPESGFCNAVRVTQTEIALDPPIILNLVEQPDKPWSRLRTLHSVRAFAHPESVKLVVTASNDAVWLWLPIGDGGIVLVGSDLAGDLVRYRQGDPAMACARPADPVWGFSFERSLHLFEKQLEGEARHERHADWWAKALVECVCERIALPMRPILPGGAPGAVVITGDDDQAYLEKYEEQIACLAGQPMTYFLHPLTRHTRASLRSLRRRAKVDLGIHPDAIESPRDYGRLLHEQVAWYQRLSGERPVSVRNHGFLSDGYWGHLRHWIAQGIQFSANLPGVDGRVLNGSLLPARVAYDGSLTSHWSILTAIGDGVRYVSDMTSQEAADCVHALARSVRDSGAPGVIVLNLHPQNIADTRSMHEAVIEVVASGFLPWTMRECLEWFRARDGYPPQPPADEARGSWARAWRRLKPLFGQRELRSAERAKIR